MASISTGAIITAFGAIGPPNIVDLSEFAPDFPTTALFGRAFRCLERLECLARLPGDSRTPSEEELFILVSGKESSNLAGALLVRWFRLFRAGIALRHRIATCDCFRGERVSIFRCGMFLS